MGFKQKLVREINLLVVSASQRIELCVVKMMNSQYKRFFVSEFFTLQFVLDVEFIYTTTGLQVEVNCESRIKICSLYV
jgi:hypothetical protein